MKTLIADGGVLRVGWDAAGVLRLWHLLSLDAPTVAALWTVFVARAVRVELPWNVPVAMFAAVWAIYAADRLLDAGRQENLEARHRFHGVHRRGFVMALAAAGCVLLPLIVMLPDGMVRLYAGLGGLLAVWLGVIHVLPRFDFRRNEPVAVREGVPQGLKPVAFPGSYGTAEAVPLTVPYVADSISEKARPIPKEIAVGVFFGAAVFVPAMAVEPSRGLLVAAVVLANLCSLNCLFIYAWEHPARGGGAHASTRFGMVWLREIAVGSMVIPLALMAVVPAMGAILIAASLAAGGLLMLDGMGGRMERTTLRAAADAALLTPLLLMPFLR